jgi:hypothetical protein
MSGDSTAQTKPSLKAIEIYPIAFSSNSFSITKERTNNSIDSFHDRSDCHYYIEKFNGTA